jgi:hypothetical protein
MHRSSFEDLSDFVRKFCDQWNCLSVSYQASEEFGRRHRLQEWQSRYVLLHSGEKILAEQSEASSRRALQ